MYNCQPAGTLLRRGFIIQRPMRFWRFPAKDKAWPSSHREGRGEVTVQSFGTHATSFNSNSIFCLLHLQLLRFHPMRGKSGSNDARFVLALRFHPPWGARVDFTTVICTKYRLLYLLRHMQQILVRPCLIHPEN